jgi:hypothetical protein
MATRDSLFEPRNPGEENGSSLRRNKTREVKLQEKELKLEAAIPGEHCLQSSGLNPVTRFCADRRERPAGSPVRC